MTINGIGTKFYNLTKVGNSITGVEWITIFYVPILPITKLKFQKDQKSQELDFDLKEIIKTYIFGWILIPLFLFWPMILSIEEVGDFVGLPPAPRDGLATGDLAPREILLFFAIIWLVVWVWKLKDRDDAILDKLIKEVS